MEHLFLKNIAVYRGEIRPRTLQKLVCEGVTCAVFPQAAEAPGAYIFEDIDGTKLLGIVPANAEEAAPEAVKKALETLPERMPDIPKRVIAGKPDDSGLIFPKNGVYAALYAPEGSAPNVALDRIYASPKGTVLEMYETEGKETELELFCEPLDFSFRALFRPWEFKRFTVDEAGAVLENEFPGP